MFEHHQFRLNHPNPRNSQLNEVLIEAVTNNNIAKVKECFMYGANANSKIGHKTALMIAADKGFVEILRLLLKHGASLHATTANGDYAIHLATTSGKLECVKVLMERGSLANVGNFAFMTPLMLAAKYGHVHILNHLLQQGVPISHQLNKFKQSELTLAVQFDHSEIVSILLQRIGEEKNRTAELNQALSVAMSHGRLKFMKRLLNAGADVRRVEVKNDDESQLLCKAIVQNDVDLVQRLISRKKEVTKRNHFGLTAFEFALLFERTEIVNLILNKGEEINTIISLIFRKHKITFKKEG